MEKKHKILLVEDDVNMAFLLLDFLESNNFDVKLYKDGESGYNSFTKNEYDLCILDLMLPGLDGFSLAEKIRSENKFVPIIFLTARDFKEDKIKGFKLGADDYITKPFDEEELLCRVEALLNRVDLYSSKLKDNEPEVAIGKYILSFTNCSLTIGENTRRLTQKELGVLKHLSLNKNSIVRRDDILNDIWGDNNYFAGRSLDVFITKIRKYLKEDSNIIVENIPTVGYTLKDK